MQVAMETLRAGEQMPSVRQLAEQLAVNQNTVLKVYNELCRERVLKIVRGSGTFVAEGQLGLGAEEKRVIVRKPLQEAVVQNALVNRVPSRASRSRPGVLITGLP